jgi:hypothetical protein
MVIPMRKGTMVIPMRKGTARTYERLPHTQQKIWDMVSIGFP